MCRGDNSLQLSNAVVTAGNLPCEIHTGAQDIGPYLRCGKGQHDQAAIPSIEVHFQLSPCCTAIANKLVTFDGNQGTNTSPPTYESTINGPTGEASSGTTTGQPGGSGPPGTNCGLPGTETRSILKGLPILGGLGLGGTTGGPTVFRGDLFGHSPSVFVPGVPATSAELNASAASLPILGQDGDSMSPRCLQSIEASGDAPWAHASVARDSNYAQVAVPSAPKHFTASDKSCKKLNGSRKRRCKTVFAAWGAHINALRLFNSAQIALLRTFDRFAAATRAENTDGVTLQSAAIKALLGEMLERHAAVYSTAGPLAKAMKAVRFNIKTSKKNIARNLKRLLALKKPYKDAAKRLLAIGFTKTEVKSALKQALKGFKPTKFDFVKTLRRKPPATPAMLADYRSITTAEVQALVNALAAQGAIAAAAQSTLTADLSAPNMTQFVQDATAIPGEAGKLLATAGKPGAGQ